MSSKLTFPAPVEGATEFPYEIDGVRYEIPRFTDVIGGMGVSRRALDAKLSDDDFGTRVLFAFAIAHRDDEKAIRAFEYLTSKQQLELMDKWGGFTGAELPESSPPPKP